VDVDEEAKRGERKREKGRGEGRGVMNDITIPCRPLLDSIGTNENATGEWGG